MSLFVYVIGPTNEAGLLKIGRTGNVQRRLAQMKGTSPVPLAILWSLETEDTDLERKLHLHFASLRRHGEWFDFQGSDWRSLISAAAEELEPVPLDRVRPNKGAEEPKAQELPQIWREFQLTDGSPDWTLEPTDPRTSAPRCPCGHKAAHHGDNGPHPCGGEIPWGVVSCFCECRGFRGESPWDPDGWQGQALNDLVGSPEPVLEVPPHSLLHVPVQRSLVFKRGNPPQQPSQDASKMSWAR